MAANKTSSLVFASSFSGIGLLLAVIGLIGCNGLVACNG